MTVIVSPWDCQIFPKAVIGGVRSYLFLLASTQVPKFDVPNGFLYPGSLTEILRLTKGFSVSTREP